MLLVHYSAFKSTIRKIKAKEITSLLIDVFSVLVALLIIYYLWSFLSALPLWLLLPYSLLWAVWHIIITVGGDETVKRWLILLYDFLNKHHNIIMIVLGLIGIIVQITTTYNAPNSLAIVLMLSKSTVEDDNDNEDRKFRLALLKILNKLVSKFFLWLSYWPIILIIFSSFFVSVNQFNLTEDFQLTNLLLLSLLFLLFVLILVSIDSSCTSNINLSSSSIKSLLSNNLPYLCLFVLFSILFLFIAILSNQVSCASLEFETVDDWENYLHLREGYLYEESVRAAFPCKEESTILVELIDEVNDPSNNLADKNVVGIIVDYLQWIKEGERLEIEERESLRITRGLFSEEQFNELLLTELSSLQVFLTIKRSYSVKSNKKKVVK